MTVPTPANTCSCTGHSPERENEHVLANVAGEWRVAFVHGTLHPEGWGATLGYPGIAKRGRG